MLLLLQLLEDPLDAFKNNDLQEIQKIYPAKNILSLDNFSDQWLVNAAYQEVIKETKADIIIIRNGDAELKNLQPLLIQLPQLQQARILFSGKVIPLIERIKGFQNVEVKSIFKNSLPKEARGFFSN